eukprot:13502-Heterococcus_DN1.PRE.1
MIYTKIARLSSSAAANAALSCDVLWAVVACTKSCEQRTNAASQAMTGAGALVPSAHRCLKLLVLLTVDKQSQVQRTQKHMSETVKEDKTRLKAAMYCDFHKTTELKIMRATMYISAEYKHMQRSVYEHDKQHMHCAQQIQTANETQLDATSIHHSSSTLIDSAVKPRQHTGDISSWSYNAVYSHAIGAQQLLLCSLSHPRKHTAVYICIGLRSQTKDKSTPRDATDSSKQDCFNDNNTLSTLPQREHQLLVHSHAQQ